MVDSSPNSPASLETIDFPALPQLQIEVRHGTARPLLYSVSDTTFLIGCVPGCDLRLPGDDLPPIVCLISRRPDGVGVRKLVPSVDLMLNDDSLSQTSLADGDTIRIGDTDLVIHLADSPAAPAVAPRQDRDDPARADEGLRFQKEWHTLQQAQAQYQADIVRFDRQRGQLEQLQQKLEERTRDLDERMARLQRDSEELASQARVVDQLQERLTNDHDRVGHRSEELRAAQAALAERTAAMESQHVVLAQLRTRLERMREEVQRKDELLAEQRSRQEQTESELQARLQELERRRVELEQLQRLRVEEQRQLSERRAEIDATETSLQEAQRCLTRDQDDVRQQTEALESRHGEQAQQAAALLERAKQLGELHDRLTSERETLREREINLEKFETAREVLQEQLRRRDDELAQQQQLHAAQLTKHADSLAEFQHERAAFLQAQTQADSTDAERQAESERRSSELEALEIRLRHHESVTRGQVERLRQQGRAFAAGRKRAWEVRCQIDRDRHEALKQAEERRREFQALETQIHELSQDSTRWGTHFRAADERFARAREQLQGFLNELHQYARQARNDIEILRRQTESDAEQVRQQSMALHHQRDVHRVAVAEFRQQMIDWQEKVGDLKRSLSQSELRMEQRQVDMDAKADRLARQSEEIQVQEKSVIERRQVMQQHLLDMREWYREKLRDLTERFTEQAGRTRPPMSSAARDDHVGPTILSLVSAVERGDRRLGEILRENQLVDENTLTVLLAEARQQRRSLRQVLLSSGTITVFQLALIEAGNLDGLMLGPVRIMDRLRVTRRETVYRVFDPRGGTGGSGSAVLRHLAEEETGDAVHPDQFRQRFSAAARVRHTSIATTFEVLEIQGRPAVLQEWITGLAASDWPPVFAVAGVCMRILHQAALALRGAHEAGLVHAHLHPSLFILTADGTLKICGFGEPLWLASPETMPNTTDNGLDAQDDLLELGRIFDAWMPQSSPRRRRAKPKLDADWVYDVIRRLTARSAKDRYPDAATLVEDLDLRTGDALAHSEAWEQLLRHVRENVGGDKPEALAG